MTAPTGMTADLARLTGNVARNHLELIAIWREHGIPSDQTTCDTALRIIDRLVALSGALFGNVVVAPSFLDAATVEPEQAA